VSWLEHWRDLRSGLVVEVAHRSLVASSETGKNIRNQNRPMATQGPVCRRIGAPVGSRFTQVPHFFAEIG